MVLQEGGEPDRFPPFHGCRKRAVDGNESVAGKGPKSKSLGSVPHTVQSHPENYSGQIYHHKKGNLKFTLANHGFDCTRGTSMKHSPRVLSRMESLPVFFSGGHIAALGKSALTTSRASWMLHPLCTTVNHCCEAEGQDCSESWVTLDLILVATLGSSFISLDRHITYEEENGVRRQIPKGKPWERAAC